MIPDSGAHETVLLRSANALERIDSATFEFNWEQDTEDLDFTTSQRVHEVIYESLIPRWWSYESSSLSRLGFYQNEEDPYKGKD